MTPDLPTPLSGKVPSASAWLALAIVLTAMLAIGRQTQPVVAPTASQTPLARPATVARRVVLMHPARPHNDGRATLASAAL